jgi:hypothetical protein
MRAKQRWYQAWERVELPGRRPIQIYRRYHHMDAIDPAHLHPLPRSWIEPYRSRGIDLLAVKPEPAYSWDDKVMDVVEEHGPTPFRKVDLWTVDWGSRATALNRPLPNGLRRDPRSWLDRRVFSWLARTQFRASRPRTRWAQRALRILGW